MNVYHPGRAASLWSFVGSRPGLFFEGKCRSSVELGDARLAQHSVGERLSGEGGAGGRVGSLFMGDQSTMGFQGLGDRSAGRDKRGSAG